MTIGTAPLNAAATWQEIDAFIALMAAHNITQVAISYGWGCDAAGIEQPVRLPLNALVSRLQNDIAQAIYHLGEDNLYIEASDIEASDPVLKITLCHEGDIHFDADASLEARVRAEWESRGIRVWPKH